MPYDYEGALKRIDAEKAYLHGTLSAEETAELMLNTSFNRWHDLQFRKRKRSMRVWSQEEFETAYLADALSEEETKELRNNTSTANWQILQRRKFGNINAPLIAKAKSVIAQTEGSDNALILSLLVAILDGMAS